MCAMLRRDDTRVTENNFVPPCMGAVDGRRRRFRRAFGGRPKAAGRDEKNRPAGYDFVTFAS
jgi:hypothetical protein